MIKIYYADVSPLDDDAVFAAYYGRLSEYRRQKADRFRFRKDKNLSVGAGILLNAGLAEYGLTEAEMEYGTYENGKPYFVNAPEIRFNLSHSGSKVMAVFSDTEIGCDIEREGYASIRLAKRFFCEGEYKMIMESADSDEMLCRLWTLKESFMKLTGMGLMLPMNSFEISPGEIVTIRQKVTGKAVSFLEQAPFDGYRSAVCFTGDGTKTETIIISI